MDKKIIIRDSKITISIVLNALITAIVIFSKDREYAPILGPVLGVFVLVSIIGAVLIGAGKSKTGAIMVCAGCVPFVPLGLIGIRAARPILKEERAGFWSKSAPWVIEAFAVIPFLVLIGYIAGTPLQKIVESEQTWLVRMKLVLMRDHLPHAFKEAEDTDDFATLKALVEYADIGSIPLDMLMRDPGLFKYAVDKGVDVNAPDKYSARTPLHNAMIAITGAKKSIVLLLLDHGADINAGDNEGSTALMYAIWNFNELGGGDIEMLNILISRKANVNAADYRGTTPLQIATYIKNPKEKALVIALLTKAGAKR